MSKSSDDDAGEYRVGYRKPPLHSRFRKGSSGNPSGWRRRTADMTGVIQTVLEEAHRPIEVIEGGKVKRISAVRAVLRSQLKLAIKGNGAAQRAVAKQVAESEALLAFAQKTTLSNASLEELDAKLFALVQGWIDRMSPAERRAFFKSLKVAKSKSRARPPQRDGTE